MNVSEIKIDENEARALYQKYKEHSHFSTEMDREIRNAYRLISQGKVIIKALESVLSAGLYQDGFPKLAIQRADLPFSEAFISGNVVQMTRTHRHRWMINARREDFGAGAASSNTRWQKAEAHTPIIPAYLRPKTALDNYYILWEAVWKPEPPGDPLLLRRLGKADLWLVLAAWDLTPVEQAVMAGRIRA